MAFATARLFKVTPRSISKWLKLRDEGKLQAVLVPRHKLFLEQLKAYIDERPDSTLVDVILTEKLTRY